MRAHRRFRVEKKQGRGLPVTLPETIVRRRCAALIGSYGPRKDAKFRLESSCPEQRERCSLIKPDAQAWARSSGLPSLMQLLAYRNVELPLFLVRLEFGPSPSIGPTGHGRTFLDLETARQVRRTGFRLREVVAPALA